MKYSLKIHEKCYYENRFLATFFDLISATMIDSLTKKFFIQK